MKFNRRNLRYKLDKDYGKETIERATGTVMATERLAWVKEKKEKEMLNKGLHSEII